VNRDTISRIENGRGTRILTLKQLAGTLNVPIEDLIELKAKGAGGRAGVPKVKAQKRTGSQ
jgi:transcriptional regulator with XRE-family HTH domain